MFVVGFVFEDVYNTTIKIYIYIYIYVYEHHCFLALSNHVEYASTSVRDYEQLALAHNRTQTQGLQQVSLYIM